MTGRRTDITLEAIDVVLAAKPKRDVSIEDIDVTMALISELSVEAFDRLKAGSRLDMVVALDMLAMRLLVGSWLLRPAAEREDPGYWGHLRNLHRWTFLDMASSDLAERVRKAGEGA